MELVDQIDLTLVLPLYNEGPLLRKNLPFIFETLSTGHFSFEILLIDDCSGDGTPEIGRQFAQDHPGQVRFIQNESNLGRGATVTEGFQQGRGTVVGYIDVDCEGSPKYILDFVPNLIAGRFDCITGMRIYPFTWSTAIRTIMSISYRFFVRLLLGVGFRDRQTGYKFFRREKIVPVLRLAKNTGWFWDTEIMVLSSMAGLRIQELPILFLRDMKKKSTVRLFRDTIVMLRQLVRFHFQLPALRRQLQKTLSAGAQRVTT
jgi:glycosyltransferase involved in cell wall biosynthesis